MKRPPSRNRQFDPENPRKKPKSLSTSFFPRLVVLVNAAGLLAGVVISIIYYKPLILTFTPILRGTPTPTAAPTPIPTPSPYISIEDLVERKNKAMFKSEFYNISGTVDNKSLNINKIFETEELKQVKFVCDSKSDKPTMVARTLNGDIPIIVWEYDGYSLEGYNPLIRCNNVAVRFENARKSGSLEYNFVTIGTLNGWDAVCLVKNKGDSCTDEGLLFTLHDEKDSKSILLELVKVRLEIKYGCLSRSASGNCSGLLFTAMKQ